MLWDAVILMSCCLPAAGEAPPAARPAPAAQRAAAAAPAASKPPLDTRDVLLMLDDGPLHLRFRATLNGVSLPEARNAYVDKLMRSLDTDGDGKLTRAEAGKSPLLTTKRRTGASGYVDALEKDRMVTRSEILQTVERAGGETVIYRQDTSAANNDLEVFKSLDTNGSGLLEKDEILAAAAQIILKDQDRDECVSFQEFLPPPDPATAVPVIALPTNRTDRPSPKPAELLSDTAWPLLPGRLLKKYDRNRDDFLSPAELNWSAERVKKLDRNGDKKLDASELARIGETAIDLEIAVELTGAADGQPALKVISAAGERIDNGKRPDFARVVLSGSVVSLSFRKVDPIPAAIANSMQMFNRLDVDGNGYLEPKETSQLIRFERGLFEALDADGDGKIFGEEMEKYVRVRGEPAATSCRVHVYDTGRGFFQSLDKNGDGRISIREARLAETTLMSMMRNGGEALKPTDPVRHFHIEFVRGSYQLFGPTDQMVAQSPSFEQRSPVGPIWFQRMDRNSDGDLTWNEFLGPREVFHRLDLDHDGLIDSQEAEKATDE